MDNVITIEVTGLKELEKKMIELGPKLAMSALRSALVSGAKVIKEEVQLRAPVLTGKLSKRAIYIARVKEAAQSLAVSLGPLALAVRIPPSASSSETYVVSVRHGRKEAQKDRDAFYWKFLEFGTKFIAARPFVRPAFEAKKFEAVKIIKQKLFERIEVLSR